MNPTERRLLAALRASVVTLVVGCAGTRDPGQAPAAPQHPPAALELRAGETVEHEVAPGESRDYSFALAEGHYARFVLQQRQGELEASLYGPGGEPVAEAGPSARWATKVVSLVTPHTGSYRLRLSPRHPAAAAARYRLQIEEIRPAADGDEKRVAAQRAFAAALRERKRGIAAATESALGKLQETLLLCREIGDVRGEVDALNEVGWIRLAQADLQASRAEFARALERAPLDYLFGRANALSGLGAAHARGGDGTAALESYQQALAIWERLDEPRERGITLCSLGHVHFARSGGNDAALALYERALPLLRGAGDSAAASMALNGIGLLHKRKGDAEGAEKSFHEALLLSREAGDVRGEANLLTSLAGIYLWKGELQAALDLYLRALESARQAGDRAVEADTFQSLGAVYYELGELGRALKAYESALGLYRDAKMPQRQALALSTIGWIHFAQGDAETALDFYAEALALARTLRDTQVEALALYYSGMARTALADPAAAIDLLREALVVREAAASRLDLGRTRLALGTAYAEGGRPQEARAQLDQALGIAREIGSPPLTAACLLRRADLERSQGRLLEALTAMQEALAILESVRNGVSSRQLRTSFLAFKHGHYERYVDLLMELHDQRPEGEYEPKALAACEQGRARGLLELLAEGRVEVEKGVAVDLKAREADLDRRLSWTQRLLLQALAAAKPDTQRVESLRETLAEIGAEREQLESEVRRRHPAYAAIRYPEPVGVEAIQLELDGRTALLEYCLGEERSFLFVVTREGLASYRLPPRAEIDGAVRRLRLAVATASRRSLGEYVTTARRLHDQLLAPAADILTRKPRLLIAADGALHLLPFEALLSDKAFAGTPDRFSYLIKTHAVGYIPSAGVLASLRQPGTHGADRASKRLVAFADPTLEPRGGLTPIPASLRIAALPNTRREVLGIAKIYSADQVELYFHENAVEENVKRNRLVETAERVHFATHGFVDEEQPQLSGLVLARRADSEEDGLLQMYEIFNLSLVADLVVLSACDTGLGRQVTGEGLVGMTRAFLYAGAGSLVVSLWKVADAPTPELMLRFYRGLEAQAEKSEALRQAKLELIAGRRFAHPAYWSPFVLVGEPN